VPTSVARRVGALTALEDTDGPAVALGDAAARHVRLRPDGLQPALGDTLVPLIEGIFGGSSGDIAETPTFPVRVTTDDGAVLEWRATAHYLSGYRRRDAALAARLVDHVVAVPYARVRLARPDDLLSRLGEILRPR
jgi:hypothetical protein